MGIDSEILKKVVADLERSGITGGAVEPIVIKYSKLPSIIGASAYIEDTLTRVLYNPGENQSWFTGEEFFKMWVKPLLFHLGAFGSTHAVSSFDDPENVPREKAKTQLARIIAAARSKAIKKKKEEESGSSLPAQVVYSHDMQFCDEGIYDPKVGKAQSVAAFNMNAVTGGDRRLRKTLWNFLFDKLKQEQLPDDRVIYIETEARGPHKFTGSEGFVRDEGAAHGHGESDPSCAFWVEYLCLHDKEGKTAIVRSKDGDMFPILLHAVEMQERYATLGMVFRPVYWMSKFNEIYDMRVALKRIKAKYKFTESMFMIYCILCGCDYHQKKLISHGFSSKPIFDAFEMVKEEFRIWETTLDAGETQDQRDAKEELALVAYCRQLYQNAFTGTVKGQLSVCRTSANEGVNLTTNLFSYERIAEISAQRESKKWQMPTRAAIHEAYLEVRFQYRYWRDRSRWPKWMYGRSKQVSSGASQTKSPVTTSPHFTTTAPSTAAAAAGGKCMKCSYKAGILNRLCESCAEVPNDLTSHLFEDEPPTTLGPTQHVDENGKHQCLKCSYNMGIVHRYCHSCQGWLASGKSFPVVKSSEHLHHEEVKKPDESSMDDDFMMSFFAPAPPGGPTQKKGKQTKLQLANTVAASSASSSASAYTAEDIIAEEERVRKVWGAPPPSALQENWCECGTVIPITKGKCDDCRRIDAMPRPRVSLAKVIEDAKSNRRHVHHSEVQHCKSCLGSIHVDDGGKCLKCSAKHIKRESMYTPAVQPRDDDQDMKAITQLDADEQAANDELKVREAEMDAERRHEYNSKRARDLTQQLSAEAKRFKEQPPPPAEDEPKTRSAAGFVCHRPLASVMRSGTKRK